MPRAADVVAMLSYWVRIRRVGGGWLETVSTGQAGSRVIARQPISARSRLGVKWRTGGVAIISDPFSIRRTRVAMLAADIRRVIGGRQASNVAHRIRVTSVWDSRHVTEPSERVGPRPSAIGYVANGGIAAF